MADKYKFRVGEKPVITVDLPTSQQKPRSRGALFPYDEPDYPSRRLGGGIITFYDLAQVNTGTEESPVWSDHPILFSPNYSVDFGGVAHTANQNQFVISERFGTDQFQDYYDMMFDIPVEEWSVNYRKLVWYGPGAIEGNDLFLQPYLGDLEAMSKPYIPIPRITASPFPTFTNILDASAELDSTDRTDFMRDLGFAWTSRGWEFPRGTKPMFQGTNEHEGWLFSGLNQYSVLVPDQRYKFTTEYDPMADDAFGGELPNFSGPIDWYLMPQVYFFHAHTTEHAGWLGERYTLGLQFEIVPRKYYPELVEFGWDDGGYPSNTDPNNRKDDWINYQKGRADRRCSIIQMTSGEGANPKTGFESSSGGSAFPVDYWQSNSGNAYYPGTMPGDGPHTTVVFPQALFPSNIAFDPPDHLLLAVIKMGGTFYYLWYDQSDVVGSAGRASFAAQGYSPLFNLGFWP